MDSLYNHKGVFCTVVAKKYIFATVYGAPILINLNYNSQEESTIGRSTLSYGQNTISSDDDFDKEKFAVLHTPENYFVNVNVVWWYGKPIILEELKDGMEITFDAIFIQQRGYQAVLIWSGEKPSSLPILGSNQFLLCETLSGLDIFYITLEKSEPKAHICIDGNLKQIPFTYKIAYLNDQPVSTTAELFKICSMIKQKVVKAKANILKLIDSYLKPTYTYFCSCIMFDCSPETFAFHGDFEGLVYSINEYNHLIPIVNFPTIYFDVKYEYTLQGDEAQLAFSADGKSFSLKQFNETAKQNEEKEGIGYIYLHEKENSVKTWYLLAFANYCDTGKSYVPGNHVNQTHVSPALGKHRGSNFVMDNTKSSTCDLHCNDLDKNNGTATFQGENCGLGALLKNNSVACINNNKNIDDEIQNSISFDKEQASIPNLVQMKEKNCTSCEISSSTFDQADGKVKNDKLGRLPLNGSKFTSYDIRNVDISFWENLSPNKWKIMEQYLNNKCFTGKHSFFIQSWSGKLVVPRVKHINYYMISNISDNIFIIEVCMSTKIFIEGKVLSPFDLECSTDLYFDVVCNEKLVVCAPLLIYDEKPKEICQGDSHFYYDIDGIYKGEIEDRFLVDIFLYGSILSISDKKREVFNKDGLLHLSPLSKDSKVKLHLKKTSVGWEILLIVYIAPMIHFEEIPSTSISEATSKDYPYLLRNHKAVLNSCCNDVAEIKTKLLDNTHFVVNVSADTPVYCNNKWVKLINLNSQSSIYFDAIKSKHIFSIIGIWTDAKPVNFTTDILIKCFEIPGIITKCSNTKVTLAVCVNFCIEYISVDMDNRIFDSYGILYCCPSVGDSMLLNIEKDLIKVNNWILLSAVVANNIAEKDIFLNLFLKIVESQSNNKGPLPYDNKEIQLDPATSQCSTSEENLAQLKELLNSSSVVYVYCSVLTEGEQCVILVAKDWNIVLIKKNFFKANKGKLTFTSNKASQGDFVNAYIVKLNKPVQLGPLVITHRAVVAWCGSEKLMEEVVNVALFNCLNSLFSFTNSDIVSLWLTSDSQIKKFISTEPAAVKGDKLNTTSTSDSSKIDSKCLSFSETLETQILKLLPVSSTSFEDAKAESVNEAKNFNKTNTVHFVPSTSNSNSSRELLIRSKVLSLNCSILIEEEDFAIVKTKVHNIMLVKKDFITSTDSNLFIKGEYVSAHIVELAESIKYESLVIKHRAIAAWHGPKLMVQEQIDVVLKAYLNFPFAFTNVKCLRKILINFSKTKENKILINNFKTKENKILMNDSKTKESTSVGSSENLSVNSYDFVDFYNVTGKVCHASGFEGILKMKFNKYSNPYYEYCYFNKTAVYISQRSLNTYNKIEFSSAMKRLISSQVSFAAHIYECNRKNYFGYSVAYASGLLWTKKKPKVPYLFPIQPAQIIAHDKPNGGIANKENENSPKLKHSAQTVKSKPVLEEKGYIKTSITIFPSKGITKEGAKNKTKADTLTEPCKKRASKITEYKPNSKLTILSEKNELGISQQASTINSKSKAIEATVPAPLVPVTSRKPGMNKESYKLGVVANTDITCGELKGSKDEVFQFSREKCFLYGISLYCFALSDIVKNGIGVEYELDDSGYVQEVWIGGGPLANNNLNFNQVNRWCKKFDIPLQIKSKLLEACGWIPSSCDPIASIDLTKEVVSLS